MNIGGVLLCGGSGTRLLPTTKYLNKHLMPIYDKPMVYYSLSILLLSGIRDITIVTNPNETKIFKKFTCYIMALTENLKNFQLRKKKFCLLED